MADVQELKWLEESRIPTMRTFVEMGWTMQLDRMIPVCRKIAAEHERQDLIAILVGFDEWLNKAKDYEAMHGVGSLFRHDHPVAVKASARRKAYLAKTKLDGGNCAQGAVQA